MLIHNNKNIISNKRILLVYSLVVLFLFACGNKESPAPPPVVVKNPVFSTATVNDISLENLVYDVNLQPAVKINFTEPLKQSTVAGAVTMAEANGVAVAVNTTLQNDDKTILIQPAAALGYLKKYSVRVGNSLMSSSGGRLQSDISKSFITRIDSSRKFPLITDNALLDLVQQQTFKYFWDFGHPVSGLARERNTSADIVTSGGSGFGIMAIPVAINRNFITRAQGLARMQTIVAFLKNNAVKVKGAFPHWLNGSTGAIVPFSANDNGADLVETSYLMMGLLTARQYFNGADAAETTLRSDINTLYNNVEWDWFRQGNQNVLYWHYSPDRGWVMNLPIRGWNECLITYVLAAASATHGIPAAVYTNGWTGNGSTNGFINGNTYYTHQLPLGTAFGGPLFFAHYSFMGINPTGLTDAYANYEVQTRNHSLINYKHSIANPRSWYGYSDSVWGLTASDISGGYTASSPTNDIGVIAPTAAISSIPYTPAESMKALKFFYYVLGDKLWKEYGFIDAFSLKDQWFASSFLAIDQGPIVVMIENYRTGLLWNLFTSCPEVKAGMLSLGFSAPYL
ncbi:MAG: Ig-like domain-containing protein [Chitinophagales bacterium]|nr:Ig-like domain-containing protein [Chitinophagales bacterium]